MFKTLARSLAVFFLISFFAISLKAETVAPAPVAPAPSGPNKIDPYLKALDKKFDRGALNFVAGWTELVRQPKLKLKNKEDKNKALKVTEGLGQGLVFAIADTLGGFGNAFTALIPSFEIPLPQGGIKASGITGGEAKGYSASLAPAPTV